MEAQEHLLEGTRHRQREIRELRLLRAMVQDAGLFEPGARSWQPPAPERRMLERGRVGALQALLFRAF